MSLPPCPQCNSEYVYQDQANLICPECGHEWNPSDAGDEDAFVAKDANGAVLEAGDKVTFVKDLKVKTLQMINQLFKFLILKNAIVLTVMRSKKSGLINQMPALNMSL